MHIYVSYHSNSLELYTDQNIIMILELGKRVINNIAYVSKRLLYNVVICNITEYIEYILLMQLQFINISQDKSDVYVYKVYYKVDILGINNRIVIKGVK